MPSYPYAAYWLAGLPFLSWYSLMKSGLRPVVIDGSQVVVNVAHCSCGSVITFGAPNAESNISGTSSPDRLNWARNVARWPPLRAVTSTSGLAALMSVRWGWDAVASD